MLGAAGQQRVSRACAGYWPTCPLAYSAGERPSAQSWGVGETLPRRAPSPSAFDTVTGAGGSRVTHVAGHATYQAALTLQQQLCEVTATLLGCPTTAVTLDNGACVVHSAPTQRLTFAEIAAAAAGQCPLRAQKLYRVS